MKYKIVLFLILNFKITIFGQRIHEYMSEREINLIFNQEYNKIRETNYEVVPVVYNVNRKRDTNSEANLKIEALNKKYNLYLEENENQLFDLNTVLYIAKQKSPKEKNDESNVFYETKFFHSFVSSLGQSKVIKNYHDSKSRASITVFTDKYGVSNINGMIGDNVYIHPLPSSIKEECIRNLTSDFILKRYCKKNENYHIVVDMENRAPSHFDLENIIKKQVKTSEKNLLASAYNGEQSMSYDESKIIAHPELLVVVDYETFELHDKDFSKLATYMATFWNAVDLRFRQMKQPEIRLYITGLVVPSERNIEPYLVLEPSDGYVYYSGKSLSVMGNYFYEKFHANGLNPYDIVVGIVNKHIFTNPVKALGYAFIGEACRYPRAIAMVKDEGGFLGVTTATHELGHVLGAEHDGKWNTKQCPEKGYLMGPVMHDAFQWSTCSLNSIQNYIRRHGDCLMNKPNSKEPLHWGKKLPGKLMSRDEQCKRIKAGSKSINNESCKRLTCESCALFIVGCYNNNPIPPAEGSSCGEKKICLNGECVEDKTGS